MKRSVIGAAIAIVFSLGVGVAVAQSPTKVNLPFSFSVNGHAMPAGSYDLKKLGEAVTLITNHNGASIIALAEPCESMKAQPAKMVFHKIGDRYFLNQVWLTSGSNGLEFPATSAEKEAITAVNTEPAGTETVVIALR